MIKLPVVVEHSVRSAEAARARLVTDFNKEILSETANNKTSVTCYRGCSSCCYHPVVITVLEGVSMYRWLSSSNRWTQALRQDLEAHHRKVVGLDFAVWMLSLIPCPFLQGSVCSVHEGRPFQCRTTYSIGDPHYCHPHRFNEATEMVQRSKLMRAQDAIEGPLMHKHQQTLVRIPMSSALLIGEKVCKGELDLEDTNFHIGLQWAEALDG